MAYQLMLKQSNGRLTPLILSSSPYYQKIAQSEISGNFRKIDIFTSSFAKKDELIRHLKEYNILPKNIFDGDLVIAWDEENASFKSKQYKVLFLDSSSYIANPDVNLFDFFEAMLSSQEADFFLVLFKELESSKIDSLGTVYESTLSNIKNAVKRADEEDDRYWYALYPDDGNYSLLKRFFMILIHKYNLNEENYKICYEKEFNWWMVHRIIEFVNEYKTKLNNSNKQTRIHCQKLQSDTTK